MRSLQEGDRITLVPRSLKGKNRIREHGSKWEVCQVKVNQVLVRSCATEDFRWVQFIGDPNFTIE